MVEYLSGGRIQGSSTLTSPNHTSWKELGRATLSSSGDVMTSGTITAKDNMMILYYGINDGEMINKLTFNDDTGNNYAYRLSDSGGSDTTTTSNAFLEFATSSTSIEFTVADFVNVADKEKLGIANVIGQNTAGAGNAPRRRELACKWANSSDAITKVTATNSQSGSFGSGSELVVLGCDNDEADAGTPFWQEIKDVTLSSNGDALDSGTITAKKYLFVTWKTDPTGGNTDDIKVRFNNDSGSNYAYRRDAGSSDETFTSTNNPRIDAANGAYARDGFMYIINKSDKEKLIYAQDCISQGTGGGQAPRYIETAMKWANTSAQITRIELLNQGSGDIASGSHMRIFGAD